MWVDVESIVLKVLDDINLTEFIKLIIWQN